MFSDTMEKEQYRSVIRFLVLDGKTCEEIKTKLDAVYENSSPSMTIVRYWFKEFKCGRSSVFEERPGSPANVLTEEIVEKVHNIILADRRTNMHEIAEAVGMSYQMACIILYNLELKNLSTRWVPRFLTVNNKRMRLSISEYCLDLFKRNPNEFFRRVVTVDETWIHYTPEIKQESKQWTLSDKHAPKKANTVPSVEKVMVIVFWNAQGVIFIDYIAKGETITGQYYADLLGRFDVELKKKRSHLAEKKVLFHQDDAPAHSSAVAKAKLVELRYELLPHPPYSPDLAPCNFFLFPNLEKWLSGKKFTSNEEVIAETKAYFAEFDKSYFSEGLEKWLERWKTCILLKGDYVEQFL